MSEPDVNSPYKWQPTSPLSSDGCCCVPFAVYSEVLLQDLLLQMCKLPLSNKPKMSLSLFPSSFFGLEAGQLQGLQACGVQPNTALTRVHSAAMETAWA